MGSFSIGLSGIKVAQQAIELVGTNIANAATPGYHRQDPKIVPIGYNNLGVISIGGSKISAVRQAVDMLLERQLLSQQTNLFQITRELTGLQTIESAFGNLETADGNTSGLDMALKKFFASLTELSSTPGNEFLQSAVVSAADGLASQFHYLGEAFDQIDKFIITEAEEVIKQINGLTAEIAELNGHIGSAVVRGGSANLLRDQRDQAIMELSELVEVRVTDSIGISGTVDVTSGGTGLVVGSKATNLEVALAEDGKLQISIEGASYYISEPQGGTLGGILALKNEILPGILGDLDTLASEIVSAVNQYHVQGIGEAGSFTELTGWIVPTTTMENWNATVSSGSFFVRVIDTATGAETRTEIAVDPTTDDVTDIRDLLDAVAGLSASVVGGALKITADSGKKFDFLPVLFSAPASTTMTGTSVPTISGVYNGSSNQTLTATVTSAGANQDVGVDSDLTIEIRDEASNLIDTIDVGLGYAAGDIIKTTCGIKLSFTAGTLNNGESFTIQALVNSDTSGFLAAAGINTFFSGSSARDIAVDADIIANPKLVATSLGDDNGNLNVKRISELANQQLSALGNSTLIDFYQQLVSGVGSQIYLKNARHTSIQAVIQQLSIQRSRVSEVDINEEAAKLLIFEQMYQAMAKHISIQQQAIQHLMELV